MVQVHGKIGNRKKFLLTFKLRANKSIPARTYLGKFVRPLKDIIKCMKRAELFALALVINPFGHGALVSTKPNHPAHTWVGYSRVSEKSAILAEQQLQDFSILLLLFLDNGTASHL